MGDEIEGPVGYLVAALRDATTDQLFDELKSRFPVCVFAGLQEAMGDANSSSRILSWDGCAVTVVGLLDVSRVRIMDTIFRTNDHHEDGTADG